MFDLFFFLLKLLILLIQHFLSLLNCFPALNGFLSSLMNAFYFCYTVFKILFKSAHCSDVSPSDHEPIGCI